MFAFFVVVVFNLVFQIANGLIAALWPRHSTNFISQMEGTGFSPQKCSSQAGATISANFPFAEANTKDRFT